MVGLYEGLCKVTGSEVPCRIRIEMPSGLACSVGLCKTCLVGVDLLLRFLN